MDLFRIFGHAVNLFTERFMLSSSAPFRNHYSSFLTYVMTVESVSTSYIWINEYVITKARLLFVDMRVWKKFDFVSSDIADPCI